MLAIISRKKEAEGSKKMASTISEWYSFYQTAQEFVEILEPNILNINVYFFI